MEMLSIILDDNFNILVNYSANLLLPHSEWVFAW